MALTKITRNYQVTLPKEVRELENLHIGDRVRFVIEGNHQVHLVKLDKEIIKAAAGLWAGLRETGLGYEHRLRKGWARRKVQ